LIDFPQLTDGVGKLCTYTVIRDPISHFLSGYNEADFRLIYSHKNEPGYNWTTPTPYFNISFTESNETRRERFTQLVKDVVMERTELSSHYVFTHFFSMSRILPLLHNVNLTLSGYLPSLENLEERWPKFITETCPEMPPLSDFPNLKKHGQHQSSKDKFGIYRAAKEVWNDQGHVARALCVIHAMDYACWTDLPDGIPRLCQEVYSTDIFQKLMLD
jgi:hypothetical protein